MREASGKYAVVFLIWSKKKENISTLRNTGGYKKK